MNNAPTRSYVQLNLQPITLKEASEFISQHHRHHKPGPGWKFGIGVNDGEKLVGVAVCGRPVSRNLDDKQTLEVTRLCTDGTPNAPSMLYAACWRAARAMGYKRLITYTLETEPGTSLLAAGWRFVYRTSGGSWSCESRPRTDKAPTCPKHLWEIGESRPQDRAAA